MHAVSGPEPIALYWGDSDWTCSFKCGVIAGYVYGWFTPYPHRELTLEETQVAADIFWESDDTSTYSVYPGETEHLPPPGTRCRNPYCERRLA